MTENPYFDDNGNFNSVALSATLRKNRHILTMRDNLDIFVYNGDKGFYEPNGKQILRELISMILGYRYKEHYALETINHVTTFTSVDRASKEPPLHLIPLKNGILNISRNPFTLEPHNPEHFFPSILPIEFSPKVSCPKFLKFLEEVLPKDLDRLRLQEHVGHLLWRNNRTFQIAVIIYGPEDSGKSTFLAVLEALLGLKNITNLAVQEIVNDNFAASQIYTKYAVIRSDIPNLKLRYCSKLKSIISGDSYSAQFKYKDRFDFNPHAKLWFSANEIPETEEISNAWFRRWDLFEFPIQFQGFNCNRFMLEEITTPEELSGILNWALEGLSRLLKNKAFSNLASIKSRREIWLLNSSPLFKFIKECCTTSPEAMIQKYVFYEEYRNYCVTNNLAILTMNQVGEQITRLIPNIRTSYPTPLEGERRVEFWQGIIIK